jgi:hypothetical protein
VTKPIHILVPKDLLLRSTPTDTAAAHFRFAAELRRYTDSPVSVRENGPASATDDGFLVVLDSKPPEWAITLPVAARQETLARVILMRCQRAPGMLALLEAHGVAGGVENLRFRVWETHPERDSGFGIAGLCSAVQLLGGECAPEPFISDRYYIYASPRSTTLPQALAEYVASLSRM